MQPKMEEPKQYTPEEMAELEKSRTISDAELLKGGAEYLVDERGEKELHVTEDQRFQMVKEMEHHINSETEKRERGLLFKDISSEKIFNDVILRIISATDGQQRETWENIIREIKDDAVGRGATFDPALETCICPTCMGAHLVDNGDEKHGRWLQRLAASVGLNRTFLKDL